MFEHFANSSRQIIAATKEHAESSGAGAMLPAHLLQALAEAPLLDEEFTKLHIDKAKLINMLNKDAGETETPKAANGKLQAGPIADILRRSLKICLAEGSHPIEPQHLLKATIQCADDGLLEILHDSGYSIDDPEEEEDDDTTPRAKSLTDFIKDNLGLTEEEAEAALADVKVFHIERPTAERKTEQPKKTQKRLAFLDTYGVNLTQKAIDGKLDPVIGRDKEIKRVINILARRYKNNPVLLGEPGTGKTAVVDGLAQELLKETAPASLRNKKIYALDLPSVVAGTRFRGDFEERIKKIMKEASENPEIILFIDEIHMLIGSGTNESSGGMDGGNIMKPALARGEIQTIGATTLKEYRSRFEKDAALERRFQPVSVEEPSVEDTLQILYGLRDRYEEFHQVTITNEALKSAAELSSRYIQDRFLPDKAIDLIDEASALVKLEAETNVNGADVSELDTQLEAIAKEKHEAILKNTYTKASTLNVREHELILERKRVVDEWKNTHPELQNATVTDETIAGVLAEITGIPVYKLTEKETAKLLHMEKELHKRVIGQQEPIKALARTIRRQRTGLKDPNRPVGSFIFAGPTGVGKTELAKALAEFLFNDEKALISLDMSEYADKHTVSRLFGSPPGYVGYDEGGQLTERVRQNPFSVVLFDEIEKAHPEVLDSLLQILEEGRLTDGKGRVVDFKNTIIVMTTNLGAKEISTGTLGFQTVAENSSQEYENMKAKVMKALKEAVRPEFLNRVDEVLVFPHLTEPELLQIVDVMLAKVQERLLTENITLVFTDKARAKLAYDGYDKNLGARPLRRVIQRVIETPLSEIILFGKQAEKMVVDVNENNEFTFNDLTHKMLEAEIDLLDKIMD